jgi:hypothetical protein
MVALSIVEVSFISESLSLFVWRSDLQAEISSITAAVSIKNVFFMVKLF